MIKDKSGQKVENAERQKDNTQDSRDSTRISMKKLYVGWSKFGGEGL